MEISKSLVKQYAASEALFRGTALASNLILLSIVAVEPRFGAEGILTSAFLQFTIGGLLEIPTSRFADRKGWFESVKLGLFLKIFNTLCYIAAVISLVYVNTTAAWAFITLECIIDAFANAFLNGAYQAAYINWYEIRLRENGIALDVALPLFVSSFAYGLVLRLAIPATALLVGSVFFMFFTGKNPYFVVYLVLLFYILILRFLVLLKTTADLLPVVFDQVSKKYEFVRLDAIVQVSSRFLILYGFATLLSVSASFYFFGEIYKSLYVLLPDRKFLWLVGTFLGFIFHIANILVSRLTVRWATKLSSRRVMHFLPFTLSVLAFTTLSFLQWHTTALLKTISLFFFALTTLIITGFIQRWIVSNESRKITNSIRATWISLGEVAGLLIFGLLSGISLVLKIQGVGIAIFLISFVVFGISISFFNRNHVLEPGQ